MAKKKSRSPRIKAIRVIAGSDIDIGTPELHQRVQTQVYGSGKDVRARTINNPLDYYLNRELISDEQHYAGRQYYGLWYRGGQAPRYQAMNIMAIPAGTSDGDSMMIMRERYHEATLSFRTAIARQVVFGVVCLGEYANRAIEMQSTYAQRRSIISLRDGLDDLVDHFSMRRTRSEYKSNINTA